jgi:hypothetical protein
MGGDGDDNDGRGEVTRGWEAIHRTGTYGLGLSTFQESLVAPQSLCSCLRLLMMGPASYYITSHYLNIPV